MKKRNILFSLISIFSTFALSSCEFDINDYLPSFEVASEYFENHFTIEETNVNLPKVSFDDCCYMIIDGQLTYARFDNHDIPRFDVIDGFYYIDDQCTNIKCEFADKLLGISSKMLDYNNVEFTYVFSDGSLQSKVYIPYKKESAYLDKTTIYTGDGAYVILNDMYGETQWFNVNDLDIKKGNVSTDKSGYYSFSAEINGNIYDFDLEVLRVQIKDIYLDRSEYTIGEDVCIHYYTDNGTYGDLWISSKDQILDGDFNKYEAGTYKFVVLLFDEKYEFEVTYSENAYLNCWVEWNTPIITIDQLKTPDYILPGAMLIFDYPYYSLRKPIKVSDTNLKSKYTGETGSYNVEVNTPNGFEYYDIIVVNNYTLMDTYLGFKFYTLNGEYVGDGYTLFLDENTKCDVAYGYYGASVNTDFGSYWGMMSLDITDKANQIIKEGKNGSYSETYQVSNGLTVNINAFIFNQYVDYCNAIAINYDLTYNLGDIFGIDFYVVYQKYYRARNGEIWWIVDVNDKVGINSDQLINYDQIDWKNGGKTTIKFIWNGMILTTEVNLKPNNK